MAGSNSKPWDENDGIPKKMPVAKRATLPAARPAILPAKDNDADSDDEDQPRQQRKRRPVEKTQYDLLIERIQADPWWACRRLFFSVVEAVRFIAWLLAFGATMSAMNGLDRGHYRVESAMQSSEIATHALFQVVAAFVLAFCVDRMCRMVLSMPSNPLNVTGKHVEA